MAIETPEELSESEPMQKKPNKAVVIVSVIGGMLLVQCVVLIGVVKVMSKGPAEASAIEIDKQIHGTDAANGQFEEVWITKLQCPYTGTGQSYLISMDVYASVPKRLLKGSGKDSDGLKADIERHMPVIKDRMRTIVASADHGTLYLGHAERPDYGLSTLKRQFKTVLEDVLGKGTVKDIHIPEYMQTPTQ